MWILYAFLASWLQAGGRLVNQYRQLPGLKLTFAVKTLMLLYSFPLLFFIIWPADPVFYLATAATGPLAVYQDKSLFNFTARFGAGAVTRLEPLSVPIVFTVWLALNPALLQTQLQDPLRLAGIAGCIFGSAFFASRLRHCPVNLEAIKAMIPVILSISAINIVCKTAIDHAPGHEGVVLYLFIQSLIVVVLAGVFNRRAGDRPLAIFKSERVLSTAFLLSLCMTGVLVLRVYGFMLAANPAYVTAVMLTGPFWVLLFYRIVRHEEKGDIRAGIGIVLSAIALTVLVATGGN